MNIDPWILSFSLVTVIATIFMGFWAARRSKTASDFFVAGRSVSVGWNASAISGEYLSAASFMGVAGMVMSSGYDALWYPVCYACGYLFLLLFIAGPLRRFGAYTIPDFAEGRYDSPIFRKIAVIFVMFIGFFYTMPQMKGAGTTLAYIFPGLPYWVGVALVGAVITLNVALGGMKGITLVQAFQYWAKMFAISVPIFVLMSVYGHYGKQLGMNSNLPNAKLEPFKFLTLEDFRPPLKPLRILPRPNSESELPGAKQLDSLKKLFKEAQAKYESNKRRKEWLAAHPESGSGVSIAFPAMPIAPFLEVFQQYDGREIFVLDPGVAPNQRCTLYLTNVTSAQAAKAMAKVLASKHLSLIPYQDFALAVVPSENETNVRQFLQDFALTKIVRQKLPEKAPADQKWISPFGPLTTKAAAKAGLKAEEQKPFSLLYTYSLIIALVCGTAGLPHILVRFYTNPDGFAAKRTTMWVMILIGIFYVFPPVFGVMGRNLLPELYLGAGSKGTDKVVLELPRILNERVPMLGSILSGITCAGAFAAFMSTFSGLLVSMTGALAHDVYGRMLRPKATAEQRLKAFKISAIIVGAVAIGLGTQVEALEINFMVGQAFAIAAASYFPLLFMSVWWRGMTTQGAAAGMLIGGLCALVSITLTSLSDVAVAGAKKITEAGALAEYWAHHSFSKMLADTWVGHPLARILCEQPAIWAVPLALGLMFFISKASAAKVPDDIRMKMLVLHAPEQLGLKQEYIQEHVVGAGH
jgi:Na+(H+)/acetate symporter ActP